MGRRFRKHWRWLRTPPKKQASLSRSASNRHGRVPDSVTSSTASRSVCASAPTTKRSIASCAFVKNQILIWRSHFCAEEILDGTRECSPGPCLRCFANLTVTRRSWLISFHDCPLLEISIKLCVSDSANCHVSRSITRSWRKRIVFSSWRPALIGTTSEAGERLRIILKRTHVEMRRTAPSRRSIPATISFSRKTEQRSHYSECVI